jgi:S1-C subfamily serine protease
LPRVQVARVTLLDGQGVKRDFTATLAGQAKSKDLVVLKINAPRELLSPATLGTSSGVKVGQQCLAIGNPFGFDHTLTTGAVSGLNRVIPSQTGAQHRIHPSN